MLGAPASVLALVNVFSAVHGSVKHANIPARIGPLNWVFSMAELHRWHHSPVVAEANHNYGGNLILWDVVFGTRYLPADRKPPSNVGLADAPGYPRYPSSYVGQFLAPLRWNSRDEWAPYASRHQHRRQCRCGRRGMITAETGVFTRDAIVAEIRPVRVPGLYARWDDGSRGRASLSVRALSPGPMRVAELGANRARADDSAPRAARRSRRWRLFAAGVRHARGARGPCRSTVRGHARVKWDKSRRSTRRSCRPSFRAFSPPISSRCSPTGRPRRPGPGRTCSNLEEHELFGGFAGAFVGSLFGFDRAACASSRSRRS